MTSTRPSREETLMSVAQEFALRSTCSRAHVGVVIAREGRILTTGYNGAPAGMPHCEHVCNCRFIYEQDVKVHRAECSSQAGCKISVHAEANAIAYAARYGIPLEGAELYSTYMPCLPCAQLTINAGISRIIVKHLYRDRAGAQLLEAAGIDMMIL